MFTSLAKRFTKLTGAVRPAKSVRRLPYRPHLEGMEERMVMAGDVTATFHDGFLSLTEKSGQAGKDNGVEINRLANGAIFVEGLVVADGTKSLVNGGPSQAFLGVRAMSINFGVGQDVVLIGTDGPISLNSLNINMGTDSESVIQRDQVFVTNFTGGSLNIGTGAGADLVAISDSKLTGNLNVNTGEGGDLFAIHRMRLNNLSALMGNGFNNVLMQDLTAKNSIKVLTDTLNSNGGDTIRMTNVNAGFTISISTFIGPDDVTLNNVHAVNKIFVNLGVGFDSLSLLHISANEIEADGGDGFDVLFSNDTTFSHTKFRRFEEFRTFQLDPGLLDGAVTGLTLLPK